MSFLVTVLPVPAWAQDGPTASDTATVVAARRTLTSDLRNFVVAQESHYAYHNTYAPSLVALGAGFRATAGVRLVLLTSTNRGHSEIATDDRVPGLVCAMYVGDAPPPLGRGDEGEVVCRGP